MMLPFERGELSCRRNCRGVSPFFVHSLSRVLENPIVMNRKRTGAMLSPCLVPTYKGIVVSIFPINNLTLLSLYILAIAERRAGGHPYFSTSFSMRAWLEVSKP